MVHTLILVTLNEMNAAGNRTTMTDGLGSVSYQYDPLSRMTSESRVFSSLGSTPYTLTYAYTLAGQLTNITDPWNAQVGYTRDIIGRLMAVTGSGYPNIPQAGYASQFQYRAWGALKSMTYGNGVPLTMTYTNRMQVSNYKITSTSILIPSPSMDINYSYSADGRLKLSTDNRDATLDRAYKYDQVGRLVEAFTASEARSWVQTGNIGTTEDGPYRQSYTLDTWDNMGTKWGRSFTGTNRRTQTVTRTYEAATGRVTGWGYDNAGNNISGDGVTNSYDAAGRLRYSDAGGTFEYDGDGVKTKSLTEAAYVFFLRSTVLGQTLEEIKTSDGTRWNGFVFADGELIATQSMNLVYWQHRDPSQRSTRTTDSNQDSVGHDELDPNGSKVDIPVGNHYNGGSGGGHILGSGGAAARVASLMDIIEKPPPLESDCQRLANIVENYAQVSSNAAEFIQLMVDRFIGPTLNGQSGQDFEKAVNIGNNEFGSSGFKQRFVDSSNQVRHFAGGLWAGYLYGPGIGELGMNSNEDNSISAGRGIRESGGGILPTLSPSDSSKADVALNNVSVPLGANLVPRKEQIIDVGDRGGWKKIPSNPGYKGLAAAIRSQLCE